MGLQSQKKKLNFRRSIYVAEDIRKGEKFSNKNLRIVRPGMGAPPHLLKTFLGKLQIKIIVKVHPLILNIFFK